MTYMTPNYQVPAYSTAPAPAPSYNYNNQQQQMLNYSSNTYAPKTNYLAYAPTSNSYSKTYAPMDYSKHYADNSQRQWNTDNSMRQWNIDNSNHYTDNSNHYADYSKYYTDNSRKSNFQNYQSYVDNSYVSNSYVDKPHYSNYSPSLKINPSKPQAYSNAYAQGTDSYFPKGANHIGEYGGGTGTYATGYGDATPYNASPSYGGGGYGKGGHALALLQHLMPNGLMDPNTFFNS